MGYEDPEGDLVQCYCDATIALPIFSHALSEKLEDFKRLVKIYPNSLSKLLNSKIFSLLFL